MGPCVPSIAPVTFGNAAMEKKSTLVALISSAARWKWMCYPCCCSIAFSSPDSVRVMDDCDIPNVYGKSSGPRDERLPNVWATPRL